MDLRSYYPRFAISGPVGPHSLLCPPFFLAENSFLSHFYPMSKPPPAPTVTFIGPIYRRVRWPADLDVGDRGWDPLDIGQLSVLQRLSLSR